MKIKKLLLSAIIISFIFELSSCSNNKLRNTQITNTIMNLNEGDFISIVLRDGTMIDGIFLKQNKSEIIIGISEKDNIRNESIQINSIYKINKHGEKDNKKPNVLISIGLILLFIIMLSYASLVSGLGNIGI